MNIKQDSAETQEADKDDKTFITKLLGEMKTQFNSSDKKEEILDDEEDVEEPIAEELPKETEPMETTTKSENPSPTVVEESNDKKEPDALNDDLDEKGDTKQINGEEKPRLLMKFVKPLSKSKSLTPVKKKPKNGYNTEKIVEEVNLKRSSRRRSSESILQSAIARKEKSYNESSKPQRSSRQLKPTQKILDNLASAAAMKYEKHKIKSPKINEKQKNYDDMETDSNEEKSLSKIMNDEQRKHKKHYKHKKNVKRFKSNDSDSDHASTTDYKDESFDKCNGKSGKKLIDEKMYRRSQRLSSSRTKEDELDESDLENVSTAEDQSIYPAEPECSSVGAELIASRLCLCIKQSQLYTLNETNEIVYCKAIDHVGNKFLGCNNMIEDKQIQLFRTSHRVPYMILCEGHKNRLYRHNCCPSCGVFCTQGRYVQCENNHIYHRDCQICVGNIECCPHCGISTPTHDVHVSMLCSNEPVVLPLQKIITPSAKMTFQPKTCEDETVNERTDSPLLLPMDIEVPEIIDVNQEYDVEALFESVKQQNLNDLALILGSKTVSLISVVDESNGFTVLHYAVKNGMLNVIHMLVLSGIDVDVFDYEQNTPLMVALIYQQNEIVKYLVKVGASIVLKGTDGMTSLHLAAKCGNLIGCQILISTAVIKRTYVDCVDDGGWTSLVWACEHGHLDVAKYLISQGADIMLRDVEQNIALHWASFSGSTQIIELLLNLGSDINAINAHGDTPLHIGSRQDSYNSVIILLARGADVTILNKLGESALDCTTKYGDCYKALSLNTYLRGIIEYEKQQYILTNDISKGKESNPIQCINTVNNEPKPIDFVYVSKNCITTDINIDYKITSLQACGCEDRCISDSCNCGKNSISCWYDQEGKLVPDFNYADPPMIFECNEACSCNVITCINRVVQSGVTQRFQLFRTEKKGWGIKTLKAIPKGTFVCEYIGEIINDYEADQREDDSYLFDLDNRENDAYCIDARHYGNFARFINHDCSPNLIPIRIFIDHQDLRFPRIALFANRDIQQEEELSFDYGEKFWIIKCKAFTCECNSINCKYSQETISDTIAKYKERLNEKHVDDSNDV